MLAPITLPVGGGSPTSSSQGSPPASGGSSSAGSSQGGVPMQGTATATPAASGSASLATSAEAGRVDAAPRSMAGQLLDALAAIADQMSAGIPSRPGSTTSSSGSSKDRAELRLERTVAGYLVY